jgi:hypothetical protein
MSDQQFDEEIEYDALRQFAWHNGYFAQVHKNFDPLRQPPERKMAYWYLQRSKKENPEAAPHELSILRYALADEVYTYINEHRKQANG